jgi:hypothetical protein
MLHHLFFFTVVLLFFPGQQLNISLFRLFPTEFPGENCNENDNEQKRQQENAGIEIPGISDHRGPFVPSGEKIDPNGNNKQECQRYAQEKLPEGTFLFFTVGFPVNDKGFFFLTEHVWLVLMLNKAKNIEQKLKFRQVYG